MPTTTWPRSGAWHRIGSAAVVCAAGAGTLLGLSGTASAAVGTAQSLEDEPGTVKRGTELTFSGTLTGVTDRPLAGEEVQLQWRGGADDTWKTSGTGTTNADGAVAIPATITQSADWRITYPGDRVHDPSSSRTITVESTKPVNQRIVDAAAAQAGKPYAYGAAGPDSFDCSGLTQYVHREVGIDLPRTTDQQEAAVTQIAKSDKQPGDLIFFHDGGSAYHVGIYAGDNKIWAAPESGDVVHLQDIWTDSYSVGRAW